MNDFYWFAFGRPKINCQHQIVKPREFELISQQRVMLEVYAAFA